MMRPDAPTTIANVVHRLGHATIPALSDNYAIADVALMNMLLMSAAHEAENGIANRLADCAEMRVLLRAGAVIPSLPDALAATLAEGIARCTVDDFRLSAVDRHHDAATRALIDLHAHVETRDDAAARDLDGRIWQHLAARAARHALPDTVI